MRYDQDGWIINVALLCRSYFVWPAIVFWYFSPCDLVMSVWANRCLFVFNSMLYDSGFILCWLANIGLTYIWYSLAACAYSFSLVSFSFDSHVFNASVCCHMCTWHTHALTVYTQSYLIWRWCMSTIKRMRKKNTQIYEHTYACITLCGARTSLF